MSRPKTASKSAPQSVSQGTPETAPQNAVQGTPATALQSATQAVPPDVVQSVPQNAPQAISQGTAPVPIPMVEVRIDKMLDGSTRTKAFASANLFGQFAIHGLRVVETDKGRFISMPQGSYEKNGEKKYTDTFHPITAKARNVLVEAVNIAYEQKLAEQTAQLKNTAMQVQAGMGGMQA